MTSETTVSDPVDEAARRAFEAAWRSNAPQPVENFLPERSHPLYRGTLRELVQIELEMLWKSRAETSIEHVTTVAAQPRVEDYLARFPALDDPAIVADLLREEYRLRHQFGDRPAIAEYRERFPQLTAALNSGDTWTWGGANQTKPENEEIPIVAGYQLIRRLGRGAMGIVYEAQQVSLNRRVALKMISSGVVAGVEERERFRAEATLAARLQHPHVVQIFEVGEQQGRPYFSMEFVAGGNLSERLARRPMPGIAAAQMILPLAEAIHAAHQSGVIHRDLKPANVLLTATGVPKISDFGIAKQFDSDSPASGLTRTDSIIGTPSYMAPEQTEGKRGAIGQATDVYGLGAILYEMLTGWPPFRGETLVDTIHLVRVQEPLAPRRLVSTVPRDLETICLKCLQKQPRSRYASAADLAADLKRFLAGLPIAARPVGRAERLRRWSVRNPALAGGIVLAVVSLLVVTVTTVIHNVQLADRATKLSQQQAHTKAALDESHRVTAQLALNQGTLRCEQNDVSEGLMWLVRGLENAPEDDAQLQWSLRTALSGWLQTLNGSRPSLPHPDRITAVDFSPNSELLATAASDRAVRIWDTATCRLVGQPMPHEEEVLALAFSPDGQLLATGGRDGAQLWDVSSRRCRFKLGAAPVPPASNATTSPDAERPPTGDMVIKLSFSADGKLMLVIAGTATRLWNTATGEPAGPALAPEHWILDAVLSPDGTVALLNYWNDKEKKSEACLRRTQSGEAIGEPLVLKDSVTAVAFNADGHLAATGSATHWEAPNTHGPTLLRIPSPDEKLHGEIATWDVTTGKQLDVHEFDLNVRAVAFEDHDELMALVENPDHGLQLISPSMTTGGALLVDGTFDTRIASLDPRSHTAICSSGLGLIGVFRTDTGTIRGTLMRHPGNVSAVRLSPDGKRAASGGADRSVRVWDLVPVEEKEKRIVLEGYVAGLALSPNETTLACAVTAGLQRFDAQTGEPLPDLPDNRPGETSVCYSPDGKLLFTAGNRKSGAQLWDAATGRAVGKPLVPAEDQLAPDWLTAGFLPDGHSVFTLAGKSTNRTLLQHWDTSTSEPRGSAIELPGSSTAIAAVADGTRVAMGDVNGIVRIWSLADGQVIGPPLRHASAITALALDASGGRVVVGTVDGAIVVWDSLSGKQLRRMAYPHAGLVDALAISPSGRMIVSGGIDGNVCVWDAGSGVLLEPRWTEPSPILALRFSADGRVIWCSSATEIARLMVPQPMEGSAEKVAGRIRALTCLKVMSADGVPEELSTDEWNELRKSE